MKGLRQFISLTIVLTALFALATSTAFAASFTSVRDGTWTSNLTWSPGNVIGSLGNGDGQFGAIPADVAVDAAGNIYVTDAINNRVEKFDPTGHFLLQWGSSGTGAAQFAYSGGITIDRDGNVWVVDQHNNRVEKFNSSGNFLFAIGWGVSDGASQYEICTSNCQAGIATDLNGGFHSHDDGSVAGDSSGHIYVGDYVRVQKFDTSATFLLEWNMSGVGNDSLDLATDLSGNVYTAEYGNNRVEKFNSSGTLLLAFGWGVTGGASHFEICTSSCQVGISGTGDGQFSLDNGITVDSAGNIYVGTLNASVQKFDSSGDFLSKWSLPYPNGNGFAIDAHDTVYTTGGYGVPAIYKYDTSGNPVSRDSNCDLSDTCVAGTDCPGASDSASIASSTTVLVPASFAVESLIIGPGGTLSQGSASTLTLSGNWTDQGTYTASSTASVVLGGTNQDITGNTTFSNLTESVSSADTLSFDSNAAIAVSGLLSLKGLAGNLLTLAKSTFSFPVFSSQFTYTPSNYPSAIAVDSSGNTYLADCGSNPGVYEFNPSGTLILSVGTSTLSCPFGVAVDLSGNIYTADTFGTGAHIYKYAPNGTEITSWGSGGVDAGSATIDNPVGILYDNGRIYVAACNGTGVSTTGVYVFDTSGNFITHFGQSDLDCPYYINADSGGNVYVADASLNTIFKYSSSGTLISSFKVTGASTGAEGVAVDSNGFIYAARGIYPDVDDEIYIFSPSGSLLTTYGTTGTGPGQFSFYDAPITFDSHGTLYTVDNNLDTRVQKFSIAAPASSWNISAASTNLSYLSVSHSTAASTFSCTTGCVDGGGNTNWVFGTPAPTPTSSGGNGPPAGLFGGGPPTQPWASAATYPKGPSRTSSTSASSGSPHGSGAPHVTPAALPKNHQLYDLSSDIHALQQFLNTHGFTIASSGPGSPGQETDFFGMKTYQGLVKFQKANGLPATGYLGPLTRALIEQLNY